MLAQKFCSDFIIFMIDEKPVSIGLDLIMYLSYSCFIISVTV